MSNFWVSWYDTTDLSEFELHTPWWVSGIRVSDDARIIVAAVKAIDEDGARTLVLDSYDEVPDFLEWRSVERKTTDWSPFGGRFQKAEWMAWVGDRTCACTICKSVEPFPLSASAKRGLTAPDAPVFEAELDRIFPGTK